MNGVLETTLDRLPTISHNTDAIIKYRNHYASGTTQIVLKPGGNGTRNIITALITSGNSVTIGFGNNGTIDSEMFEYSQATGPIDLTPFFAAAPFSHYMPNRDLIIDLQNGETAVIAYVPYKA